MACFAVETGEVRVKLCVDDEGGTKFVRVRENVDFGNAEDFGRSVEQLIDAGVDRIVFDLSEIKFINSTGIGILALTYRAMRRRGGRMIVIVQASEVKRLFGVTNFVDIFEIVESEEEAVALLDSK